MQSATLQQKRFSQALLLTMVMCSTSLLPAVGRFPRAPTINRTDAAILARSGRLLLFGSGFGSPATSSRLLIDGKAAITTTWTDTEIHGYVPETARVASVFVQVVTNTGSSNKVALTVKTRSPIGRVRWRFQVDSMYAGSYIAVGADGTIYATDIRRLYALTPDGALKWVLDGTGGRRPIVLGKDGTIYTGRVHAVPPNGTFKWKDVPPLGTAPIAGPGIGADGNIYAVESDFGNGRAVFSLDPQGKLRWAKRPSPGLNPTLNNSEIEFGNPTKGQLYFGVRRKRSGPAPSIYCYDFKGKQVWYQSPRCQITYAKPDRNFRLSYVGPGKCGMTLIDENGKNVWNTPPPTGLGGGLVQQVAGPDGTIYTADFFGQDLWAVDANGKTKYFLKDRFGMMANMGVSPDNRLLIDGGRETFGKPGWVRGYKVKDGSLAFQVDLPDEGNLTHMTWSVHPEFSKDSRTVYYSTIFLGNGVGHTYVYAIDLCTQQGSSSNYGTGWTGSKGIPTFMSLDAPVLGNTIRLQLSNSLGSNTAGILALGLKTLAVKTPLGGTLLVLPSTLLGIAVPTAGLQMRFLIPSNPVFCSQPVFLQAFEIDKGATHGLSFSRGLQLLLGLR